MLQTVWNELDYRVDVCRTTNGAHIERLKGTVDPRVTIGLTYELVTTKFLILACDQSLELRPACRSRPLELRPAWRS
jgi:hypothetical protein